MLEPDRSAGVVALGVHELAMVARIRDSGHDLDPRAVDIADALTSNGVHDSLVGDSGWSYDDYEDWLKRTLVTALLR